LGPNERSPGCECLIGVHASACLRPADECIAYVYYEPVDILKQPAEEPIPETVRRFIVDHIRSVESLEILLLLFGGGAREFSPPEVSRNLCTSLESATAQLQQLHKSALLVATEAADSLKYRFNSGSPDTTVVADLEKIYKTRRVSVISFIYSKPTDPLRAFSDAFKFRKDEP
jgi:hypothetical protein